MSHLSSNVGSPRRTLHSRVPETELLCDVDHERQLLIAVMGCNSPAAEHRQVYARNHEGLIRALPTGVGLIAGERRGGAVQAPAGYS